MDPALELAARIAEALAAAGFHDVRVSVDETGAAHLTGAVASPDEEAYAVQIAQEQGAADVTAVFEAVAPDQGPPAPDASPASPGEATTYTVQKGDSYWGIAKRFYGDGRLYPRIQGANPDLGGLHPGKTLVIPPLDEAAS